MKSPRFLRSPLPRRIVLTSAICLMWAGGAFASHHIDEATNALNTPPQELIHPEQFGIEEFGHHSARAALAAQSDDRTHPVTTSNPASAPMSVRTSNLPTTISNGTFSSGTSGWQGIRPGNPLYAIPDSHGPQITYNNGYAAPAGEPSGQASSNNPSSSLQCGREGEMWQDIHVKPGTRLSFNWQRAHSGSGATAYESSLRLLIKDPYSGRTIWNAGSLSYVNQPGGRFSEVDLSAYAGLDVSVRFQSGPAWDPYGTDCNDWTWFDNVNVYQAPVVFQNVNPTPGIWYNRFRDGGGWDLRRMPDGGYYGIWYTFEGGQPVWYYLDPAPMGIGSFNTRIRKMVRTGTTVQQTVVGRVSLAMLSSTSAILSYDFTDFPNADGIWDNSESFELLTAGGPRAYNGFWHTASGTDPNWGLTTTSYGSGNLFSTQYYYEPNGEPTWAYAQGAFNGNGTLSVKRTTGGLCPNCPGTYPSLVRTSIGKLELSYPSPSSLTMQATFNAGDWQRSLRTYYKLTY